MFDPYVSIECLACIYTCVSIYTLTALKYLQYQRLGYTKPSILGFITSNFIGITYKALHVSESPTFESSPSTFTNRKFPNFLALKDDEKKSN